MTKTLKGNSPTWLSQMTETSKRERKYVNGTHEIIASAIVGFMYMTPVLVTHKKNACYALRVVGVRKFIKLSKL